MKVTSSKKLTGCLVVAKERIRDIEKTEVLLSLCCSQILVDLDYFGVVFQQVFTARENASHDDLRTGKHTMNRIIGLDSP